MIHIAIGTKAQFIKMAPIMRRLQESGIAYNLIDLGQHSLITRDLRQEFGLKDPDVVLSGGQNVARLLQGIKWLSGLFLKGLDKSWVKDKVFRGLSGVCLIHGDTVSTLLALYLAKRAGLLVAHVEAGLRSYNIWEPFPEEIVRLVAMRFSDILFAPSAWAKDNLHKMGYGAKTILITSNTSLESTFYSLNKPKPAGLDLPAQYALVTVHRMENIFSRDRLAMVVGLIEKISQKLPIVFVQHQPTIIQLAKFGLKDRLDEVGNIRFFQILSHCHFIHLLNDAQFAVTDGGSIQEESFYLGKPCLLLRTHTERTEGLGQNVVICGFSQVVAEDFINRYDSFNRQKAGLAQVLPSAAIINDLLGRKL